MRELGSGSSGISLGQREVLRARTMALLLVALNEGWTLIQRKGRPRACAGGGQVVRFFRNYFSVPEGIHPGEGQWKGDAAKEEAV